MSTPPVEDPARGLAGNRGNPESPGACSRPTKHASKTRKNAKNWKKNWKKPTSRKTAWNNHTSSKRTTAKRKPAKRKPAKRSTKTTNPWSSTFTKRSTKTNRTTKRNTTKRTSARRNYKFPTWNNKASRKAA
jgi:hypothetical protein